MGQSINSFNSREKERLVEIITESLHKQRLYVGCDGQEVVENIVDHLLDNGVIAPPCKVGDTVYWLHFHCTDPSDDDCDGNCYSCGYSSIDIEEWIINNLYRAVIATESWEQQCFPTREAAEQSLKERESE